MRFSTLLTVALVMLIILAACAQPAATPTLVPPTTTAPTPVPPITPASVGTTAGQLAQLGKSAYARDCGMCHDSGPGPAVAVWMQAFPDAQQLLDYASRNMPKGAAGSLKPEQYFQIVAWALVDQKIVTAGAVLDVNKLAEVATKK
jgi:hypothetical protein